MLTTHTKLIAKVAKAQRNKQNAQTYTWNKKKNKNIFTLRQ